MATHLFVEEEMATSTHLFKGWPPLPIYLSGDGNLLLESYLEPVYLLIYRPTYVGGDCHPLFI